MTKLIFGIFAHPDDESFGPSGTLLNEVRHGAELHLTTLTLGEAGANPDKLSNLAHEREKEWRTAGKRMGATSQTYLGYADGHLSNQDMIDIGHTLAALVEDRLAKTPAATGVEFITNDLNGITGHIDHIVAARAACWTFYKLKERHPIMGRVRLACTPRSRAPEVATDWIFMEAGRTPQEVDEIVDNRHLREEVKAIMHCHQTQRADLREHLDLRGDELGLDYFLIRS